MKNARLFLLIQSILYILLAGLLIAAVVGIYQDGAALRAEDPLAPIFSREIAEEAFRAIAPLFFGAVGITAAGLVLGVKSENDRRYDVSHSRGLGRPAAQTTADRIEETPSGLSPRGTGLTDGNVCSPGYSGTIGKRVRMVLLIAAIVLIAAGIFNGSARDVFGKAVKICTECIGLG